MNNRIGIYFVTAGLVALLCGVLFGAIGGLQFLSPTFFDELPFFKSRPLHVSLVVSWIFLTSVGGIYYFLPSLCNLPLFSQRVLPLIHFALFIVTGVRILYGYVIGEFGGREYWEFAPHLAIPILISWVLFGLNFFISVFKRKEPWPVYMWMWGTGIVFFFFTFTESYLWLIPYFRDNVVKELTVQWKSYGALVGSWNMLVYGTAIFVMEKLSGNDSISRSRLAFFLYFLGLVNLLFGWAHHVYIVPSDTWIRQLSFYVNMAELFIIGRIVWNWRSAVKDALTNYNRVAYRFMIAADFWIFVNLLLALPISVPAINLFTHGTHVTVAHAMGSTIGINTMILLSSCFYILSHLSPHSEQAERNSSVRWGFWVVNASLLVFFLSLLWAGVVKGYYVSQNTLIFQDIMSRISPALTVFIVAGLFLCIGLFMVIIPLLRLMLRTR